MSTFNSFNPRPFRLDGALPITTRKQQSVGASLAERRGIAPGFDGMRVYLALSVLLFHTVTVCYGEDYQARFLRGPFGPPVLMVLPIFFALSGFLIAGSMLRIRSTTVFLIHRALRIVPALCCEILLSAFVLGPLFTRLPLNRYFSNPQFADYFWNIVGRIRYVLPGVFGSNPYPDIVNGQLWTVPFEGKCYLLIAALMVLGLATGRRTMLVMFVTGMGALTVLQAHGFFPRRSFDVVDGGVLVLCFLGGITAYLWRDWIRISVPAFVVALVFSSIILSTRTLVAFSPLFLVYITVFLGMMPIPKPPLLTRGDYSYGMYLYGFPFQQGVVNFASWGHIPVWNIALSVPLTICFAVISWELIEKRVLAAKRLFAPTKTGPSPSAQFLATVVARLRQRPVVERLGSAPD
jgi:peptidoglycan/LPS O-acetylase OafA/YrhL